MANRLIRLDPYNQQSLYGRPVVDATFSPHARLSKATIAFVLIAWLATAALAFMLGRASVAPLAEAAKPAAQPSQVAVRPVALAVASPSPAIISESAQPNYAETQPRFVSTIPIGFRGTWDEIVTDKCFGREARYTLGKTTFENFEVVTNVERVRLISPTEIEISVTGYDENKNQFNEKIGFRLLDAGQTLTGTQPDSNFYRRCRKP